MFVCVPSEGVVSGAGSKEVRVFFSPDHQSKAYSDKLTVYFNDKVSCSTDGWSSVSAVLFVFRFSAMWWF